ncbi:MAG: hypothetical protein ACK2T6_06885 [Anaerolineae bacterium]
MTRYQRLSFFLIVAVGVFGLGLFASTVSADDAVPLTAAEFSVYQPSPGPDLSSFDPEMVLDETEFHALSETVQLLTQHVAVDADGIPQLDDVTAQELGVDPEFLANFKLAMEFTNQAIANGEFKVNPDLTVEALGGSAAAGLVPAQPYGEPSDTIQLTGDATVDWDTWHYPNRGAMFYNSYYDYFNYYYNRYYVLCNGMAAALGYPWMSTNLMYFYGYNNWYFSNHCYQNYGMYYYLPYSSGCCRQYNPCYCGGMSYRPVYIWVRVMGYNYNCRCYQYNWSWQGYWGRY